MNWIALLVGKRKKSGVAPFRRSRPILQTEQLEDRLVPAANYYPTYVLSHPGHGNHPDNGTGTPSGLTPSIVRSAYNVNQVLFGAVTGTGAGQTIAIIDAYNQPNIVGDLANFDATYGLTAPPSFKQVNENGGSSLPGNAPVGGWGVETSLDVEWAHAIAPGANLLLVEANSASSTDLNAAINTARNTAGVSVVSMSFGSNETASDYSGDALYTTPSGHNGVTFVASSGDSGAYSDTGSGSKIVGYPAASANVVGVGGTTLSTSAGVYLSESGWGDGTLSYNYGGSGGGISQYEPQPSYQHGVVTQSTTKRTVPDMSLDADPNSGVPVYDSYDEGVSTPWVQVGGTSLAAPMFSGVVALADQGRALNGLGTLDGPSQTLPMLYGLPSSDFHDVTTGNNGYAAGPGYDLVTGLGTPYANLVAQGLGGSATGSSATPTVGSFAVNPTSVTAGTAVTLTASNVTETGGTVSSVKFYRESNGTAGLQIGSDTLLGTGTPNGSIWTISASTTGLAAGTYTFYAVATDAAGHSSSVASTTLIVTVTSTPKPAIGSFVANPSSVTAGTATTLTASNVTETGGTISNVKFYRESNATPGLQIGSDTLVGTGTPNGSTWTISASTTGLAAGTYTFYAVATDVAGNSTVVSTTLTVTTATNTPVATTTQMTAGPVIFHNNGTATAVLTVTVTPSSGSAPPTGTIVIIYGGQVLGTGTLSVVNGVAQASFTITFYYYGYYTFGAEYQGSSNFSASTSNYVTVGIL